MKNLWNSITSKYCADKSKTDEIWDKIEENYGETHRKYHNLDHIEFMLDYAVQYKSELQKLDTVLFSIFFHDIIYATSRDDNEKKSADIAEVYMQQLGIPLEIIRDCKAQIMATQKHEQQTSSDTSYLIDFDLAVLGASPKKYEQYRKNIRKEYSQYPDFLYTMGRKKVLQYFLNKSNIYQTRSFQENHEAQARENLQGEFDGL